MEEKNNEVECKGNFETMYIASCNYYKTDPNESFLSYLKELMSKNNRELDLNQYPGIQSIDSLSLLPIAKTLCHCSFFHSIFLHNISQREDAIEIFSKAIKKKQILEDNFFFM